MIEDARVDIIKKEVKIPEMFNSIILPEMADYYSDYTVDFNLRPVVKCCLHDEDTPSMRYFEETNTFYCYGCGAGGDVIELYRQYQAKQNDRQLSFQQCITHLYEHFIRNKNVIGRPAISNKKELNNKFDLMYFSLSVDKLENVVRGIADIKQQIHLYNRIDLAKRLVLLDKITVSTALKALNTEIIEKST